MAPMPMTEYQPHTQFSHNDNEPDGWLSEAFYKHGAAGYTLGQADIGAGLNLSGQRLYLVKKSGSSVHRFPKALEAIGQIVANDQFSTSRFAIDKVCVLVLRKKRLSSISYLQGSNWHIHAPLKLSVFKERLKRLKTFGIPQDQLALISSNLAENDYLYADREAPFYQTQVANDDLGIVDLGRELAAQYEQRIPQTRAPEKTIVALPRATFHCAPKELEFAPENLGKYRIHVNFIYFPVQSMERHFHPT